jgi:hypothetical protein
MFCNNCGQQISEGMKFCNYCGKPVAEMSAANATAPQPNPVPTAPPNYTNQQVQSAPVYGNADVTPDDIANFVQSNASYYVNKLGGIQAGYSGWNWCSFLFSGYWFLYRKMYKTGFAILGSHIVLYFIMFFFGMAYNIEKWMWYLSAMELAPIICFGINGNKLYMKYVYDRVYRLKNAPREMQQQIIRTEGGTDVAAVICALVTMIAFSLFIAAIMQKIM